MNRPHRHTFATARLLAGGAALLLLALLVPRPGAAITALEIRVMTESGVPEAFILQQIAASPTPFALSADDVSALKQARVSDGVIAAMWQRNQVLAAAAAPAPAPVAAPAPAPSAQSAASDRRLGAGAQPSAPSPSGAAVDDRVRAKPPVRKLARDLGIDLTAIRGSGPGGIITRDDVVQYSNDARPETYAAYPGDEPWLVGGVVSPDGRRTRVPVRSVRRRTAEAMVSSAFSAPHVTVFHTVDVTRTMELLARLKTDKEFADLRLTPLLFAMKALLIAVHRHPEINASWDEDAQEIVYKHYVNLGIAASTPRGLVVPNIKDAHRLSLKELAQGLAQLTANARASTLTPADMSDGTITITNVGVFGIDTGTPILNPGEAAILAFGAIREQPWVVDGQIVVRHVTQLALSMDHRLVDGELGSRVLADVAKILQDPAQAMVWS